MQNSTSNLIYFDGSRYYPLLTFSLKSRVNLDPLEDIKASRASGKKVKPWIPQEENSLYITPPTNTIFISNSEKLKQALKLGFNTIRLPTRSLESNLLDLHISWHGNEGRLHVKGRKDTTFELQTSAEYIDDIVPSIKRADIAGQAVCVTEVIIPINTKSFQHIENYKEPPTAVIPKKVTTKIVNNPYVAEHPKDIIFEYSTFKNKVVSILFFVHTGTRLAPWTLEKVQDDLICEPITITNVGYKGAINCTILVRILDDIDDSKALPLIFMLKSSDPAKQVYFETIKYGE
jgi:hypothetical protein